MASFVRKFQNKNWEYTVRQFHMLSKKKDWSVRFRLAYMHEISRDWSSYWRFRIFISNLLGILNLMRYSIVKQWQPVSIKEGQIMLLFANSTGYLLHLQPVALELLVRKKNIILLCSCREYPVLVKKLHPELAELLRTFESISDKRNYLARVMHILFAFFYAIANVLWFAFQPVKYAVQNSAMFGRYAFSQYLLKGYLRRNLNSSHAVVSTSDHWLWESLFFREAGKRGASTYFLQRGTVEDITYPMFSRFFVAWGRQDYLKMTETFGASSEEVFIAGSPYFDNLYAKIRQTKKDIDSIAAPYITYLSQPLVNDGYLSHTEYSSAMDRFYALLPLAEKFGKKLLIKLHPRGKESTYDSRPKGVEISREPLFDVLQKSAITITYDSTAVFESAMFSVPAIQSVLPDTSRQMIYAGTGISILCRSEEELFNQVKRLLEDTGYYQSAVKTADNALGEYFGELSGSLGRIVNIVTGMAPEKL